MPGSYEVGRIPGEWQGRLDAQLRANLVGDLVAQVFIALAYFIYPSVWMILIWATRWMVVLAIWLGRRNVHSQDPTAAVFTVLAGHLLGALIVTVVVPEFGSITVLVIIGDLQMWSDYFAITSHVAYRRFAALTVGALSVLTLQDWTGAGSRAPKALLLVFLVGHGIGVSLLLARQSWVAIRMARQQGLELAMSRRRLQLAEVEARRDLSESIAAGPRQQLAQVRRMLLAARFDSQRPEADEWIAIHALELTDSVVQGLRDIGYGLYPPDLPSQDLGSALSALPWARSPGLRIRSKIEPAPSTSVGQTIIELAVVVASWARQRGSRIDTIAAQRRGASIAFELTVSDDVGDVDLVYLRARLNDLAGAAGGDIHLLHTAGQLEVSGTLPETIAEPKMVRTATGGGNAAALGPYLRDSLLLCGAGLVLIALIYFRYPSVELVLLGLVIVVVSSLLAVARERLRRGAALQAIGLTSLASTIAPCGVMVLLPTMAPVLVVFTVLPLIVAPSITTAHHFAFLIVIQQLTTTFILTAQVLRPTSALSGELPRWLTITVLFVVPVAISALLIRVYLSTKTDLHRENELLRASRAEVVRVSRAHRRELERDLHDGAQQVVVALAAQLRVFLRRLAQGGATARALLAQLAKAAGEAEEALAEFSAESYPTLLIERGLRSGLETLARLCPHPTTVDVEVTRPLPAALELAIYYCCSEALQNAAKHAGPAATVTVTVMVRDVGNDVQFEVSDNGRGYDRGEGLVDGRGLANLEVRVARLLGHLEIHSAVGEGCAVRGSLPINPENALD